MTYHEMITRLQEDSRKKPEGAFAVSHNKDEWALSALKSTLDLAYAQLNKLRDADPYTTIVYSADIAGGSYPHVYDRVLATRCRTEFETNQTHYDNKTVAEEYRALVNFFEDNISAMSSTATEYLTQYTMPLAALHRFCPFSLVTDDPDCMYNEGLAPAALDAVEERFESLSKQQKENENSRQGKRVIEGYTEINSFRLNDRLVILAENTKEDFPYLVCEARWDNPLGFEEYHNGITTDNYIEAVGEFIRRESGLLKFLEHQHESSGIPFQTLTGADCVPNGLDENIEGKLVIIKPEALAPEFRTAMYQLKIATGGFGCAPNSRGNAVFCKDLYSGEESRFERYQVLGVADKDKLPEWALRKFAVIEAAKEPDAFEYGGYHFKPYRKFLKGEVDRHLKGDSRPHKKDMQYAMRNMETDSHLGFRNNGSTDTKWSYEEFYATSGGSDADIFICIENGKLYVPAQGELFRYNEPPAKSNTKIAKPSLLGQLGDAKSKVAAENAARTDKTTAKKRDDMEV